MRILIIEDEPDIGRLLKAEFEAENYAVDLEADGAKGFAAGKTNDYDLVILDNILPGKTGPEICRELRAAKKEMPIIMLSVETGAERKVELFECGADDYVTKPFSLEELLARAKALLRRPRRIESAELKIGDLSIDRAGFMVSRAGRKITLTPKEFNLLEYLVKNRGRVLSRGVIMEHVWDMNGDIFSNAIETHIMNLRRKICAPGENQLIHTVSGRGYKADLDK